MQIIRLKLFTLAIGLSLGIFALIFSQDRIMAQSHPSSAPNVFTEIEGYAAWKQIHKPTVPVPPAAGQIRLITDGAFSVYGARDAI